jgi:hypothetical protein
MRKQYDRAIEQIATLRKKGADKNTIAKAQRRADALKASFAKDEKAPEAEKVEVDSAKIEQFITQAYLRSLSRYPKDDELARSVNYVNTAEDTVGGVRDVLWALLNTKEFIVNH